MSLLGQRTQQLVCLTDCMHTFAYVHMERSSQFTFLCHHRKPPVLLFFAFAAFLVSSEAGRVGIPGRGGLTVGPPGTRKPISCTSILVKLYPSRYPHCCTPGPWKLLRQEAAPKKECPSGRRYILTRKTCPGQKGTEPVCKY